MIVALHHLHAPYLGHQSFPLGLVVAGAVALVALNLALSKARETVREHGIHNLIGRALVLRPHHGRYKSDATFWRPSTDRASGKSRGRHHRAGITNLSLSLTVLSAVIATAYGMLKDRGPTILAGGLALLILAAALAVAGVRAGRRWHSNRTLITPLAVAAESIIDPDRTLGTHLGSMITMDPGWLVKKRGELGRMILPDNFHANDGQRTALENLISARLPVPVRFTWHTAKMPQSVRIIAAPPLPRKVAFRDWLEKIEALAAGVFAVGIDPNGELYTESHNGDTPWTARSMNSGTGKSVGFLVKAAQIAHQDPAARIVCVDTKQVSFEHLRGIRGIEVYDDPFSMDAIWKAFYDLAGLMRERYAQLRADPAALEDMNDIWLLVDEGNDLAVQLKGYWMRDLRKSSKDPVNPPIWLDAIAPLVWQGRQVRIRGTFALQNLMEKYVGGVNLRPSFGVVGMAGFKPSQWRTIIGTSPVPELQSGPGRICMVRGSDERWVQAFYDDPAWLRSYAEANRVRQPVPDPRPQPVLEPGRGA